jgi:electron transport complex protein RnfG
VKGDLVEMEQAEGQSRGGLKDVVRLGVILALFTAMAGAGLAQTYGVTAPVIEAREAAALMESLREGLPGAEEFEPEEAGGVTFYKGLKGGQAVGVIALTEGAGYAGPVRLMVTMDPEGSVSSVRILGMSETPGIGTKVAELAFLDQYVGKSPGDPVALEQDVQAVSGATVSSKAVNAGVQKALATFKDVYH